MEGMIFSAFKRGLIAKWVDPVSSSEPWPLAIAAKELDHESFGSFALHEQAVNC